MTKALFLDRDGVIIKDNHLMSSMDQVSLMPGIGSLINRFRAAGYLVIVVTNQTVVARGLLTLQQTVALNEQILQLLLKNDAGAIVDRTYMCPHHPKADIAQYRVNCDCRKPKSGMLVQAAKDFDIDLKNSILIGDRPTDVYAGKSVGCRSILYTMVSDPLDKTKLIESGMTLSPEFLIPDQIVQTLEHLKP